MRMRFIVILAIACTLVQPRKAYSKGMIWSTLAGTKNAEVKAHIALDSGKNIYLAGHTYEAEDESGDGRLILSKHDSLGRKVWIKTLGGKSNITPYDVAVDAENNVYVLGSFFESFEGHRCLGGSDIALFKFDGSGNRLWTRTFGTKGSDIPQGLVIGPGGSVYVTEYSDSAWDGRAKPKFDEIILFKYNSKGDRIWVRFFGSDSIDVPHGITLDTRENIYVTGSTRGSLDVLPKPARGGVFLVKYDSAGTKKWLIQFGINGSDGPGAIATDKQGNVFVGGMTVGPFAVFSTTTSPDLNTYFFLTKIDSTGKRFWTRQSDFRVPTMRMNPIAISVDISGNSYLLGETIDSLDGQKYSGGTNYFLAKYDNDGTKIQTRFWEVKERVQVQARTWDEEGFLYLAGETRVGCGGSKPIGLIDLCLMKWTPVPPSFDCAKSRSAQEKMICGNQVLSSLDDSIATLLTSIRKVASKPKAKEIKVEQAAWVKDKRNACETPEQLMQMMQERLKDLKLRAGVK